ncbi:MAG: hypothetical protein U0168_00110 [Nannocystaceae bacterium]
MPTPTPRSAGEGGSIEAVDATADDGGTPPVAIGPATPAVGPTPAAATTDAATPGDDGGIEPAPAVAAPSESAAPAPTTTPEPEREPERG